MIRDNDLLAAAMAQPFSGYAVRRRAVQPDLERVAACVAVLGTIIVGGIALGSAPKAGPRLALRPTVSRAGRLVRVIR